MLEINKLPQFLIDKLINQYGEEYYNKILNGYMEKRVVTLRVNILKTNIQKLQEELTKIILNLVKFIGVIQL